MLLNSDTAVYTSINFILSYKINQTKLRYTLHDHFFEI